MKRTMLVVLMAAVFAGGTVMPAGAHVKKVGSDVKISVSDKTPKKGRHVTFTGKVTSPKHKCEANRKVVLLRNGKAVASKMTNGKGKAKFDAEDQEEGRLADPGEEEGPQPRPPAPPRLHQGAVEGDPVKPH